MSKNTMYLLTALIIAILAALWLFPRSPAPEPASLPANGLVGGGITPSHETLAPVAAPAPITPAAPAMAPASQAIPEPAMPAPAKDKAMDADDVPASAEVAPTPNAAKPAEDKSDKSLAVPPSEGQ